MARIHLVLLLLSALLGLASAASAPTFCKCTCSKNSTIIPLDPDTPPTLLLRHLLDTAAAGVDIRAQQSITRGGAPSCSQCTKAFCLSRDLDICENVEEEDVTTMCFQRDSNKDKIIVWAFIVSVLGLLGWAAFKRMRERQEARALNQQHISYTPVPPPR
ncbi:hypothetical protein S40285_04949 [Stachybotrys chlorohalonatus IBT 40285]|uniref:Uncharacterized protein n=1 Tax=Stachybotrys chlorohalonatus (strain IBT 40285) TaxID=1283841 RepID=A0A084QUK9_STAC4|nr:hypothetical protein S40285_04949 [Stachybotrys chlorohalonata IBT 40285]